MKFLNSRVPSSEISIKLRFLLRGKWRYFSPIAVIGPEWRKIWQFFESIFENGPAMDFADIGNGREKRRQSSRSFIGRRRIWLQVSRWGVSSLRQGTSLFLSSKSLPEKKSNNFIPSLSLFPRIWKEVRARYRMVHHERRGIQPSFSRFVIPSLLLLFPLFLPFSLAVMNSEIWNEGPPFFPSFSLSPFFLGLGQREASSSRCHIQLWNYEPTLIGRKFWRGRKGRRMRCGLDMRYGIMKGGACPLSRFGPGDFFFCCGVVSWRLLRDSFLVLTRRNGGHKYEATLLNVIPA